MQQLTLDMIKMIKGFQNSNLRKILIFLYVKKFQIVLEYQYPTFNIYKQTKGYVEVSPAAVD